MAHEMFGRSSANYFIDADFPVVMGMTAGHGAENLALPFGVPMSLDGGDGTLSLDESPVS